MSQNTASNKYPFLTKAQIAARLATDDDYVLSCLEVMDRRHSEGGRQRGWMSSHAKRGTELAAQAREEGLTGASLDQARALVSHYTKQLAAQAREEEIARNPDLADEASCFFTPQPTKDS